VFFHLFLWFFVFVFYDMCYSVFVCVFLWLNGLLMFFIANCPLLIAHCPLIPSPTPRVVTSVSISVSISYEQSDTPFFQRWGNLSGKATPFFDREIINIS
jgi:hypothetical protein